jgi:NADPH:quinone reductase-like Zn-dependent oxidoreductase
MSTRSALIIQSTGVVEVKEIPRPKLGDDYIIVRTKAVALNPTDWKTLYGGKRIDRLLGCDYAGIVEEVGKDVTTFKPGDKAAGLAFGGEF